MINDVRTQNILTYTDLKKKKHLTCRGNVNINVCQKDKKMTLSAGKKIMRFRTFRYFRTIDSNLQQKKPRKVEI